MPETRPPRIADILAALPMFHHVSHAHLNELARQAEMQRVARDALLYRRGDPAAGCFALVRGMVKLSLLGPGGTEKVLRLVMPGESFAESVMFHQQPQPVDARALADSQVLFLPASALFDLLESDRSFVRALLGSLSQRIHALIGDIQSYTLTSGSQRIAAFLHSLPRVAAGAPARVRLPANKTVIASRLGVTKETFSRLLHELSTQGLIEVCQREIVLRDPKRLTELARGGAKR
jgi:CRP-like cAMP-binding protein